LIAAFGGGAGVKALYEVWVASQGGARQASPAKSPDDASNSAPTTSTALAQSGLPVLPAAAPAIPADLGTPVRRRPKRTAVGSFPCTETDKLLITTTVVEEPSALDDCPLDQEKDWVVGLTVANNGIVTGTTALSDIDGQVVRQNDFACLRKQVEALRFPTGPYALPPTAFEALLRYKKSWSPHYKFLGEVVSCQRSDLVEETSCSGSFRDAVADAIPVEKVGRTCYQSDLKKSIESAELPYRANDKLLIRLFRGAAVQVEALQGGDPCFSRLLREANLPEPPAGYQATIVYRYWVVLNEARSGFTVLPQPMRCLLARLSN
jgi:hypothetical protein